MDISKYEIQEIIFDSCPVCHKGRVNNYKPKGLLKIAKSNQIICVRCNARFVERGGRENETSFELDLSESSMKNRYGNQILKKSEWIRGISDLDVAIENNELPNYQISGLPIVLQEGETSHYYTSADMYEERAVRQHYGSSVRVTKGLYFRMGQAESHGELRHIDNGSILLTNERVIFDGSSKKIEYQLSKIMSLTEFLDGFQIGVTNRKKSQMYRVDEPHKCVTYINMAIKQNHNDTTSKKKLSNPKKEDDDILKILNLRYVKGEITKEEYEQMKRDINE